VAPAVIGREAELAAVDGFLRASADGFAGPVLAGDAGIGKTAVWQEALRLARNRGALVLGCRPAASEATMSFAALADLLKNIGEENFDALPEPQRDALTVALLRTISPAGAPSARAVAAGFLGLLRRLATARQVIVAVDDWQWLDLGSRRMLEFAARRLDLETVGLLCSVRSLAPGPPMQAMAPGESLPSSVGAVWTSRGSRGRSRWRIHATRRWCSGRATWTGSCTFGWETSTAPSIA